jgi:signal transduction histidine kinase
MKLLVRIFFIVVIAIHALSAQDAGNGEVAPPHVKIYSPKDYKAHGQNFAIVQNKQGVLYFGNFSGVLEYDGVFWKTIPTKNISKVSALFIDKMNRIIVGANDEFGYLTPDSTGALYFKSLSIGKSGFGSVLTVFESGQGIYFVTKNNIFLWDGKKLKSWKTTESITSAFLVNNVMYVFKSGVGLTRFDNGQFRIIPVLAGAEKLLDANSIFFLNGKTFILTSRQGIYTFRDGGIDFFNSAANNYLKDKEIFSGKPLSDVTLGVFVSGGYFLSIHPENGEIKKLVRENERLQGDRINYWMEDRTGVIWMGLNNGIAQMEIASPLSQYDESENLKGQVNDMIRFKNRFYAGTGSGLHMLVNGRFNDFPSLRAAVWSLAEADGALYVASSKGLYKIENNDAPVQLSDDYSLVVYPSPSKASRIYMGLENGVAMRDGAGPFRRIPGVEAQISRIIEDEEGNLWLQSQSHGILKIDAKTHKVVPYGVEKGLPTPLLNRIFAVTDGLLVSNSKGVFRYEKRDDRFKAYASIPSPDKSVPLWKSLLVEDSRGNIWTTNGDDKSVTKYEKQRDQSFKEVSIPFLPLADKTIYDIYPDQNNVTWFGGPEGLIRYDQKMNGVYKQPYSSFIRKITAKGDTVLFDGFIESGDSSRKNVTLQYKFNDVSFEFSAASLIPDDNIEFQYYLENFDKTWSAWTPKYQKEYTNLPAGGYRFMVRARNIYQNQSGIASYRFTIVEPLYERWWAYVIYMILLVTGIWFIMKKRLEFIANQTKALENLIRERTEEIVNQKEELEQQSDELSATNDQLERIDEFVKSINSEVNTVKLFQMVLDRLCQFQNVDSASGLIFNKTKQNYQFIALAGKVDITAVEDVEMSYEQAAQRYIDQATEVFEDIFVKNDFLYENLNNSVDSLFAPKSLITIVIRVEGDVKSFITMENMDHAHAFGQRDFNMVRNLKEHLIGAYIKTNILENLEYTLVNLKTAQEELIRQEKLASVGQLTKGIVDRILNPLNYINNFSQSSKSLLEEISEVTDKYQENFTEDDQDDFGSGVQMLKKNLEKIYEHGNSTTRIVKDMQKLLKGKSNEFLVTELNPFLETKARTALQDILGEYKGASVQLNFQLYPIAVKVSLLPFEFSEVIQNLISNACYAVIEKAKITKDYVPEVSVKTLRQKDAIQIQFLDNGKGIPPKEIEQIFSPFFTTKPTSKGTGLGLYMSKDIVEYHKGKMSIHSKDGEFTMIEILLPIVR